MNKRRIMLYAAALVVIGVLATMTTEAGAGYVHRLIVMNRLIVGGQTPLGEATIYPKEAATKGLVVRLPSGSTGNAVEVQNSAGSALASISQTGAVTAVGLTNTGALTGTTCTLSGTLSGTTATFSGAVAGTSAYFDGTVAAAVQMRVDGASDQSVDIFQVRTYDGAEKLEVTSAGNTTVGGTLTAGASTLASVGVTAAATVGTTLTVTGATTCNSALLPAKVTADPCTGAGYGPGAMFFNATSNYMCYCDGNTDDLKMNDNSTACF